jgi:hypothetical protein
VITSKRHGLMSAASGLDRGFKESPQLIRYGVLRFVRDLLSISGLIEMDRRNRVERIVLNRGASFARGLLSASRFRT